MGKPKNTAPKGDDKPKDTKPPKNTPPPASHRRGSLGGSF